jgi:hypothetical protein
VDLLAVSLDPAVVDMPHPLLHPNRHEGPIALADQDAGPAATSTRRPAFRPTGMSSCRPCQIPFMLMSVHFGRGLVVIGWCRSTTPSTDLREFGTGVEPVL